MDNFAFAMKRVYLDNAATTRLHPEVLEAMLPYMGQSYGNPSAIHTFGREGRAAIERSRKTIARTLGASMGEIFFTSGGTESNNMAIKNAVEHMGVKRIITSPVEHHCVLHSVQYLQDMGKVDVQYVRVDELGRVDLEHLTDLLKSNSVKTLVSVMHANNEIGTLNDLDAIGSLCRQYAALFHSDTVQTFAHFPIDVKRIGLDFMAGSGHKFHGPKGSGFVYINGDLTMPPYIHGGSQERNMRAGTENVYGIVGLGKAAELATADMQDDRRHIESLRSRMVAGLEAAIPDVGFLGDYREHYLYTVLSVSLPPTEFTDMVLYNLDMAGIAVSAGSACSSGSTKGSHVLTAIGADPNKPSVRFSFSKFNTEEEVDYAIAKTAEIVRAEVEMER
jgi:cysteine desulfurase